LTTSGSDLTLVPSQDRAFMKALDSIWEISDKEYKADALSNQGDF
jgi:hypothetical protein